MRILTLPVYSKLADDQDIPPELQAKLPAAGAYPFIKCRPIKPSRIEMSMSSSILP